MTFATIRDCGLGTPGRLSTLRLAIARRAAKRDQRRAQSAARSHASCTAPPCRLAAGSGSDAVTAAAVVLHKQSDRGSDARPGHRTESRPPRAQDESVTGVIEPRSRRSHRRPSFPRSRG